MSDEQWERLLPLLPPQKPKTGRPAVAAAAHLERHPELLAQGLSNQEIADQIAVSEPTVRTHVSRILGKLHLASRTQPAPYVVRAGLTNSDEARSVGE